ncbi:hypothetical protein ILUMI_00205 [Ignelater luminosus]|uniref:lysoplasmalogenase n=1 Tax=Ignelater luminosus TaxID=2038154 RepID=A0A8K0DKX9_IGNLU|nr:hypothetical protein ILUMI_00205 [Ignelater luminosus]
MTSVAQVIKSVGPKLVPFFKTLAIYFVVFIPQDQPSLLATVLKCLPIISLVVFIILHTKSTGTDPRFAKLIIAGMLFGCVGDACLIWPGYFDTGVLSFLIGHLIYIYAFGFKPLNLPVGIVCYACAIMGVLFFWPDIQDVLLVGVPVYSIVLMTMVWRVAARVQFSEDQWTWSKLWTCLGGISFAVSDFFVGMDHFRGSFEYDQLIIMTTYYGGQLGLALSVLDAKIETPVNLKSHKHQCSKSTTTDSKQTLMASSK